MNSFEGVDWTFTPVDVRLGEHIHEYFRSLHLKRINALRREVNELECELFNMKLPQDGFGHGTFPDVSFLL